MLYFNHCICYWNNSFRNWKRAEIRTFCRQLYLIFASTHLLINQSFLICSNIFAGLMKSIGTITCLMILGMCFSPAYNEKYQQILMMVHMLVDESMCGWHPKTTKVGGLPNYILLRMYIWCFGGAGFPLNPKATDSQGILCNKIFTSWWIRDFHQYSRSASIFWQKKLPKGG